MVYRAALNLPQTGSSAGADNSYDTYFFKFDKYVRVRWIPGVMENDSIVAPPAKFADDSASMKRTGFDHIDAILPIPGHERRAYYFSGDRYARLDFYPDDPSKDAFYYYVCKITDKWASLKQAGFEFVDGAMLVPGKSDEALFFCEDQYCHVRFHEEKDDDELLDGPTPISQGWSALGLPAIDTIIASPNNPGLADPSWAYVFYGQNYVTTLVSPQGEVGTASEKHNVASWWKDSLGAAGFY